MLFCKSCSGFSLSLGLIKLWCTGWAERAGQLGILESERSACHCTQAHRLIQKYTPNEVTESRWKWLKCIVWAQKNCQQSVKIALVRSVKLGAIIQENDASTYTDAAAHLSTRRLGSQVWGEMFDHLGGVSLFHADVFYGLRIWGGGLCSLWGWLFPSSPAQTPAHALGVGWGQEGGQPPWQLPGEGEGSRSWALVCGCPILGVCFFCRKTLFFIDSHSVVVLLTLSFWVKVICLC